MLRKTVLLALSVSALVGQDGAAIYKSRCARCHDAPAGRVPTFSALRDMSTTKVLKALETGVMKPQAEAVQRNRPLYRQSPESCSPALWTDTCGPIRLPPVK